MTKVLTDEKLIEEFLSRGVEQIYPSKEQLKQKLMSGQRLKAYQGFDPTGPYLHVGHAMGIRGLSILQKLGHEVIFLVGDFTAKVGDPDKDKARPLLTDEIIEKNMQGWKDQASQLIDFEGDNPVQFKRNFEWLSKLNLADLINLMSKTTVQQMIERDMFQRRIKAGDSVGLHEFIYPLMQGFDSVSLDVDLEIGGTDQTFNMLMGRELVKGYLNKDKFVRTNEMMDAPDGITMSKTKGNGINLADDENEMYGKAMSYPDHFITKGLRLITSVPMEDIWDIEKQMESGENPMLFKKLMAFEIVKSIKGEKLAKEAQQHFERTVQNKEFLDTDVTFIDIKGELSVLEFMKKTLPEESASQIRRVIEQGGLEINNKKVTNPMEMHIFSEGTTVKYGKRNFFKIK